MEWADEIRERKRGFWVTTERGVYAGEHPSKWTPPEVLALIEANKVNWGTFLTPLPNQYTGWQREEDARADMAEYAKRPAQKERENGK